MQLHRCSLFCLNFQRNFGIIIPIILFFCSRINFSFNNLIVSKSLLQFNQIIFFLWAPTTIFFYSLIFDWNNFFNDALTWTPTFIKWFNNLLYYVSKDLKRNYSILKTVIYIDIGIDIMSNYDSKIPWIAWHFENYD